MNYEQILSKRIQQVQPSGIRKFFDILEEMKYAISLGIGEPDFVTPWHIRDAGIYSLEKGRTRYTSNAGLAELRREIASFMERHYNLKYDFAHQIVVTVGGSEGIDLAIRCLVNPGDEVIVPVPSFVCYGPLVNMAGGTPVYVETKAELTYGQRHVSIANIPGMYERTVVVNGMSKSHAMTGWRMGYLCGPEPVITQMLKLHQFGIMSAPTMSQYAAVEAMRNGDRDIEKMREEYDGRRRYLVESLRRIGLPCFEPKGAFYVFPDIRPTGLSSEEFCERFLREEKVAVIPGSAFGPGGEGFVRACYATSMKDIAEALTRMDNFLTNLRRKQGA